MLPLNALVYNTIYAVDDLFDDDPVEWNRLAASMSDFAPASIEAVVSQPDTGAELCGLLRHLSSQSSDVKDLFDTYPEYVKLFNGLAYARAQSTIARNRAMYADTPEARAVALMGLAKANMQTSCSDRMVMEHANRQARPRSSDEHEYDNVVDTLSILLSDDFVHVNDPRTHPDQRFLDTREGRNLTGFSILAMEEYNQTQDDRGELFADLDEEAASGIITPNGLACYFRVLHPDIDLQEVKAQVQALPEQEVRNPLDAGRIPMHKLREISPELAAAADAFSEPYRNSDWPFGDILVSLEAKRAFRQVVHREEIRDQYRIDGESEGRIGQPPDDRSIQTSACDLLLRCERRSFVYGESREPHYYLSLENVDAFRTVCDNLGIRIGNDRLAEVQPEAFEGFVELNPEEVRRITLYALGTGQEDGERVVYTVSPPQGVQVDYTLRTRLIHALEDLEFMLTDDGISKKALFTLIRAGKRKSEANLYLPEGMKLVYGDEDARATRTPVGTYTFPLSAATAGRIESAKRELSLGDMHSAMRRVIDKHGTSGQTLVEATATPFAAAQHTGILNK